MNWHDPSNELNSEFRQLAQLKRDERQKELSWEKIQKRIHRPKPLKWFKQLHVPLLTAFVLVIIVSGIWMAKVAENELDPHGTEQPDHEMIVPNPEEEQSKVDEESQRVEPPMFVIPDESELIPIAEKSSLEIAAQFSYGSGENQIGYSPPGFEKLDQGPTSFFVRDDTFYILDNVNQQVVINHEGEMTSFPIEGLCWGKDIYVTEDNNVYILDSCSRMVYRYDQTGNLTDNIEIPTSINIPYKFGIGELREVLVLTPATSGFDIASGKIVTGRWYTGYDGSLHKAAAYFKDDTTGIIKLDEQWEITVPYKQSTGALIIFSATYGELIIEKTEVAPDLTYIAAESHIHSITLDGVTRGSARIPTERMTFIPDHMIRVDGRNIYLLSVEEDAVYVYRVQLGKEFESIRFADNSIPNEAFSLLTEEEQLKINRATPETLMDLYFNGINESNPLLSIATLHPDFINHEQSLDIAKRSFMGYKATNILIKEDSEQNNQIDVSKEYHLIVEFEITDLQEETGWVAGDGKQMRFVKFIKTKEDKWAIGALATSP